MKKTELTKDFHLHHIKPRKLGGSNDADNLILLHPIDHAIIHLVRYKMFKWEGDLNAAKILMGSLGEDGVPINTKGMLSGKNNPMFGKKGELHPMFGKIHPNKGKKIHTDEHKKKVSERVKGKNNPFYGKGFKGDDNPAKRPEVREKMRKPKSVSGQYKMSCIKCRHSTTPQTIKNHYDSNVCKKWSLENKGL